MLSFDFIIFVNHLGLSRIKEEKAMSTGTGALLYMVCVAQTVR